MLLEHLKVITDVCLLVEDIDRTIAFYTEKLDFKLRRKAEGFADFEGAGVILAAWELDHISEHVGVSNQRAPKGIHNICIAVELESVGLLDNLYSELKDRGISFQAPPDNYPWNARCVYFSDPDNTLWELYAWNTGGPGDYHSLKHQRASLKLASIFNLSSTTG